MSVLKIMLASLLLMFCQMVGAVTTTTTAFGNDISDLPTANFEFKDVSSFQDLGFTSVMFNDSGTFLHEWTLDVADNTTATISFASYSFSVSENKGMDSGISNFKVEVNLQSNTQVDPFVFDLLSGPNIIKVSGDAVALDTYFVTTTEISQVPLPNSLFLMMVALCGLFLFRKNQIFLKRNAENLMGKVSTVLEV